MSLPELISLLQESIVMILVFLALLAYAMVRGREALTALIFGLYLALLISLKFPYYDKLKEWANGSIHTEAGLLIGVFAFFTIAGALLFERFFEYDDESTFEGFWKKILIALFGMVLIMAYSYHVLPVTSLIEPGGPASTLFAPEERFFWWLIIPLIGLLIV